MHNTIGKLMFAACFFAASASGETLKEVYEQALENDHQFRAARAAYEAGKQEKNIGLSGLLPQVSGTYDWSDLDQTNRGDAFDRSGVGTRWEVRLTQPLFNVAAWHGYQRGKLDAKVAEADFRAAQQEVIIRVAEAYFNVLRAVDNYGSAKAEEEANKSQLDQTRKRFEVGLTAITEVHEAQAAFDTSLARRVLAEGNVGIAFEALEVLTGESYSSLVPLKDDFPIQPPTPSDRKEWESYAKENNFTLAAASLRAKSSKESSRELRAAHFPTITGSFSVDETENDDTQFYQDQETIAVRLSVPIFSGGATSARRKQAASRYMQAKENYLQTQRDIVQLARTSHLNVITDVATVRARAQAITSNRSALEATQAGYDVGTRDLVDVLQAQRSLYAAERDYADALYTYVVNTLRLKQVAGMLNEEDIHALEAWLDEAKTVGRLNL